MIHQRHKVRIKNDISPGLYIHKTTVKCLVVGYHGEVVDKHPHSSELSTNNIFF